MNLNAADTLTPQKQANSISNVTKEKLKIKFENDKMSASANVNKCYLAKLTEIIKPQFHSVNELLRSYTTSM